MIDELREERIVNKVGGRFKLSTLIQKRLVALNAGSRPLVNLDTHDKLEIVIQEIMQDKIYLDSSSQPAHHGRARGGRRSSGTGSQRSMNGREIVVGVTGGVAAYKTAALVSQLVQAGAGVSVVLTAAAREFIGAATFAALTGRALNTGVFHEPEHPLGAHIDSGRRAAKCCAWRRPRRTSWPRPRMDWPMIC